MKFWKTTNPDGFQSIYGALKPQRNTKKADILMLVSLIVFMFSWWGVTGMKMLLEIPTQE